MKYLITGKNGQLAQEFIRRFEQRAIDFFAPDEQHLDITERTAVDAAVAHYKPDVIINCAAYNLVDNAEQQKEKAFSVNEAGPRHLAAAANRHNAFVVHFGSDYVFDGAKETGLYSEGDAVNPLNEYGKSKLAGEEAVRQECSRYLILRLSWVFGAGKQNFIYKLRSWTEANDYLKIACDEFSVPTYTGTIVDCTLKAVDRGLTGRFHLTNTGFCSRYEWAKLILSSLGIKKFLRPVPMDSFRLPAKRPLFSAMSNATLSRELNFSIPTWEEAVSQFLRENK